MTYGVLMRAKTFRKMLHSWS